MTLPMSKKILLLVLTGIMGIGLWRLYTAPREEVYIPHFEAKTCFAFKYGKPVPQLDGMVMYRQDLYYIVMWTEEAERRYAGPKVGNRVPVKYLDAYTFKIDCPKKWGAI